MSSKQSCKLRVDSKLNPMVSRLHQQLTGVSLALPPQYGKKKVFVACTEDWDLCFWAISLHGQYT